MSFQGDVAGLGLGELLQGLARGGREGVLTLRGGGLSARLGVQEGQIILLPEEDEDPEIWRRRCERAWAKDPDQRIDTLRMREIAYAVRLETMFQLLDCEGVHFRFEPGPLPDLSRPPERVRNEKGEPVARMETGNALEVQPPVTCSPMGVEGMLLEYARLADEMLSHPDAMQLNVNLVPRTLGDGAPGKSYERIWHECDATSNLREIGDRLGWPIRQTRGVMMALVEQRALRFADAREMLALAQRELHAGQLARAAARLAGWSRLAQPGPINPGDVELLLAEWQKGKLPVALASIDACDARTILRRMDLTHADMSASVGRWNEIRKHHRHDALCELRAIHCQDRSQNEVDAPAMTDLLRVARKFQEVGQPWRAGIVLRLAASRGPETTSVRLEIGQRMVAVGLLEEGASWVVDACRTLIDGGTPDRAIPPLRQLMLASPGQREAKALLALAHGKTVSGKRTRRNSLVALASALVISLVAVVKIKYDQHYDAQLQEVNEHLDDPTLALSILRENFGDVLTGPIGEMRIELEKRIEAREAAARAEWVGRFQDCQLETTSGDPVTGLREALALPPAPPGTLVTGEGLPRLGDLLDGLIERLQQTLAEWGEATEDRPDAAHAEQRLATLIESLRAVAAEATESNELKRFRGDLESLALTLRERSNQRAKAREAKARKETFEQLDQYLAAARAHAQAGDLGRAVESYDRLAQLPGSEKIVQLLAKEIAETRAHYDAVVEARRLASEGRHPEALQRLSGVCEHPSEHLLPCRIASEPNGARARFPDGTSRVTPFVLEAAPGERILLNLEHDGYETTQLTFDEPSDQNVLLSRVPTRRWRTTARVEALPVSVDDDHVVCDRSGRVARLDPTGDMQWERSLESIGGVSRTPVFLAKRPGALLTVTEEGAVWIIETSDGRAEGPWRVESPPSGGPEPTANGVRVRFRDGRSIVWAQRLKPDSETKLDAADIPPPNRGHDAGLTVLRRNANGTHQLDSPWSELTVEISATDFVVRKKEDGALLFSARREGEWNYVAWEAPSARLPRGQLWISDGVGLRAFEP